MNAGFIYPIPLTEWVSNPVPVDKKQGTIRVCVDYHDFNATYPKDNYLTSFIDQFLDYCAGCEYFYFMDGFLGYNQIAIKNMTNIKLLSCVLGAHLRIVSSHSV